MTSHWRRFAILGALVLAATLAAGVEHPGVIEKDADCASCHAAKVTGKSVHSAMATTCMVCHVAKTQGDMTTLSLAMPKERICFSCHVQTAELLRHNPGVKGQCVECHDAHSSDQRMLLRVAEATPPAPQKKK